jgi:peptide/nickel transport system ATP-binding protein
MLQVEDLTVALRTSGRRLVEHFSFTVGEGEIVRLQGPSGAGKSTVAMAVCGLLPDALQVASGSIRLDGTELLGLDEPGWQGIRGGRIGVVFQDPLAALNPMLTCGRILEIAQRLHGKLDRVTAREQALEQLRRCGLDDARRIHRSLPDEISGGQRQRVMFALATVNRPLLLVADEPTSALDAASATVLRGLLEQYASRDRGGVLLITHDEDRLAAVANRSVTVGSSTAASSVLDARATDPASPACPTAAEPAEHGPHAPHALEVSGRNAARETVVAHPATYGGPLLVIEGLAKSYTRTDNGLTHAVLAGLDMHADAGEMVAVTGPSGVGKTTLARCLAGLTQPDAGRVLVLGKPLPPRTRGLAHPVQMVYQNPAASLSPLRTVAQTLHEALRASGRDSPPDLRYRVDELLAMVNLDPRMASRLPRELSGGEQQRVAIARCIATGPALLLADEPISSLDADNARAVLSLLREMARQCHIGVLVITHNVESSAIFFDRMLRLQSD